MGKKPTPTYTVEQIEAEARALRAPADSGDATISWGGDPFVTRHGTIWHFRINKAGAWGWRRLKRVLAEPIFQAEEFAKANRRIESLEKQLARLRAKVESGDAFLAEQEAKEKAAREDWDL